MGPTKDRRKPGSNSKLLIIWGVLLIICALLGMALWGPKPWKQEDQAPFVPVSMTPAPRQIQMPALDGHLQLPKLSSTNQSFKKGRIDVKWSSDVAVANVTAGASGAKEGEMRSTKTDRGRRGRKKATSGTDLHQ